MTPSAMQVAGLICNDSRRGFRLLWGRLTRRLTWRLKWHFAAFEQVIIGSAGEACAS